MQNSHAFLEHSYLKPETVEKRLFQIDLASRALRHSTLVVLPTGLGKTVIALMAILARMDKGKVLFLAPTRPLVEQHGAYLQQVLIDSSLVSDFTGETPPDERAEMWQRSRIVVSTPQVIENDLLSKRIDLSDVSLIIFDEAHRATGNYAYVYIAERYRREAADRLVLGITASPGSEGERIEDICSNLGIEKIETRTEDDPDVAPYIHRREIEWIRVLVPDEILRLRGTIEDVLEDRIDDLNALGALDQTYGPLSVSRINIRSTKKALLELQQRISIEAARRPNQNLYRSMSILAEILKLKHAVELAETQGMDALSRYFARLNGEATSRGGSKAAIRLMEDPRIQEAIIALSKIDVEHPKLAKVMEILVTQLEEKPDSRIMVFTNYRDTATALLKFLKAEGSDLIRPVRFVGQSSRQDDEGLSQKKQAMVLEKFRSAEYNVLIATSVGEEGIDIPATDMVLFYEPVPSEIRSIQRKGRTGRARAGRVVVLIAKGTRDEAYYWISDRKEKSMHKQIRGMKGIAPRTKDAFETQEDLDDFPKYQPPGGAAVSGMQRPSGIVEIHDLAATHEIPVSPGQARITDLLPDDSIATDVSEKPETLPFRPSVLVDPRERDVAKALESLGMDVTVRVLEVGDYVVSDRVGIERKTADDLVNSIVNPDRELFRQISDLSRSYDRPVLILEGRDLYARQIHPNAVRGALASIAVDYGVPIIPTADQSETASVIALLARREQTSAGREFKPHGKKTARTLKEQQEYLISAIPGVGSAAARSLLKHFGSVEAVMTATPEKLMEADGVGPKTAARIRELVGGAYKG